MAPRGYTLACLAVAAGGVRAQDWTTLARSSSRDSRSDAAPAHLAHVRWIASADDLGRAITFEGQSGTVSRAERIFAVGRSGGQSRLFCFRADSGLPLWNAPVPAAVFESWATPTIDPVNGTVLVASGRYLTAINATSGGPSWQTQLDRNTGGATPVVTTDRGGADRAFITDYDGFGGTGKLYCINVDPPAPGNPYQPGQIVWSIVLGSTGANTPAYLDGVVYVASVSDSTGLLPGQIRALDAAATTPPPPLWTFTNVEDLGFFGGLTVSKGSVFAASYAFAGGQNAANLVKLDAASGSLSWSVACNRTDSIPVPLPHGSIALSSGIRGFGSLPSVQKFRDEGAAAALEWDSALHSWNDLNNNGVLDPGEYVDVGGWTVQPALSVRPGVGPVLFVGVLPAGPSTANACAGLREVDLSKSPSSGQFIREAFVGAGSTPAITSGTLYTLGPAGLYAIGSAACTANCDQSTATPLLTANDFQCFLDRFAAGDTWANCDQSTGTPSLTANDFQCFLDLYAAGCP